MNIQIPRLRMETLTFQRDGVSLVCDYIKSGRELIVFLHGVGVDRTVWKEQMMVFANYGYSVVAPDSRGSGDSDSFDKHLGNLLPMTRKERALDTDFIVNQINPKCAHYVGNSMGGVDILEGISQDLTAFSAHNGSKIVLCNTFAKHDKSDEILLRAGEALKTQTLSDLAESRIRLAVGKCSSEERMKEVIHSMARKFPEAYLALWDETWDGDYRELLPKIRNKTLVLGGSNDSIAPPYLSVELAEQIPGARLVIREDFWHISNLNNPQEFNEIIYDFLVSE